MQGTLRTFDPEIRAMLIKRIKEIVPAVAQAYRCKVEIETLSNVPSTPMTILINLSSRPCKMQNRG